MWDARDVRAATLPELVRMCVPLAEQLDVSMLRQDQTRSQGGRRSSDAVPMIYRIGAAEVLADITQSLRFILGEWVLEQDRKTFRMWSLAEVVAELEGLRDWMVKHQDTEVWHDRLLGHVLAGLDQIDIPPERVFIGTCPAEDCTVELWPTLGEAVTVCPRCRTQVDVRARQAEGLRRMERWEAPLSRVVSALSAAGESITLEQAKHWTKRKDGKGETMLAPRAKDSQGVKLYRLGDVRDVLSRMQRRRAKAHQ